MGDNIFEDLDAEEGSGGPGLGDIFARLDSEESGSGVSASTKQQVENNPSARDLLAGIGAGRARFIPGLIQQALDSKLARQIAGGEEDSVIRQPASQRGNLRDPLSSTSTQTVDIAMPAPTALKNRQESANLAAEDLGVIAEAGRPDGTLGGLAYDVAGAGIDLGLAAATGNPVAGAGLIASNVYGNAYADSTEMGLTPQQKAERATFQSGTEFATEIPVLKMLTSPLKSVGKGRLGEVAKKLSETFIGKVGMTAGAEGLQEAVTNVLNDAYDIGQLDKGKPIGEVLSDAGYAGLVGAIAGGGVQTIRNVAGRHQQRITELRQGDELDNAYGDSLQMADNLLAMPLPLQAAAAPKKAEQPAGERPEGFLPGMEIMPTPARTESPLGRTKPATIDELLAEAQALNVASTPVTTEALNQTVGQPTTVGDRSKRYFPFPTQEAAQKVAEGFTQGGLPHVVARHPVDPTKFAILPQEDVQEGVPTEGIEVGVPPAVTLETKGAPLPEFGEPTTEGLEVGEATSAGETIFKTPMLAAKARNANGQKDTHQVVKVGDGQFVVRSNAPAVDAGSGGVQGADQAGSRGLGAGDAVAREPEQPRQNASAAPVGRLGQGQPLGGAQPEQPAALTPALAEKVAAAGDEAATSPNNDLKAPSPKQIESGVYQKGHVNMHGMRFSIENPVGSRRRPEWPMLKSAYGYIRGTKGKDKDHVDAFFGPKPENQTVYVIDQIDPATGRFDEAKTMIGYESEEAARQGYLENYQPGWKGMGAITPMPMERFKKWVKGEGPKKALAYKFQRPPETAAKFAEKKRLNLRRELMRMGIELGEAGNIAGERPGRIAPGLFRKNGAPIDTIAEHLREAGYLTGESDVTGDSEQARDIVRRVLDGERVLTAEDQMHYADITSAERDAAAESIKEEGLDIQEPQEDIDDAALIFKARVKVGEDEFDRVAKTFEDDLDLVHWAHETIYGKQERPAPEDRGPDDAEPSKEGSTSVEGESGQAGEPAPVPEPEEDQGRPLYSLKPERPELNLQAQTEEQLREQDERIKALEKAEADRRKAAEDKAQADKDREDFKLTGSAAPADVAVSHGQRSLFAKRSERRTQTGKAGTWPLISTLKSGATHVAVRITDEGKRFFYGESQREAERNAVEQARGPDQGEQQELLRDQSGQSVASGQGSRNVERGRLSLRQKALGLPQARVLERHGGLRPDKKRVGECFQRSADVAVDGLGDMVIGLRTSDGNTYWHGVVKLPDGTVYDPVLGKSFLPGVYEKLGFVPKETLTPEEVRNYYADHNTFPAPHNLGLASFDEGREMAKQTKGRPSTGVKRFQVLAALRTKFGNGIDKLLNDGTLVVVNTADDLPKGLRSRRAGAAGMRAPGMYLGNKDAAVIVADEAYLDELPGLLLHEIGEHYGLPKMLGDDAYAKLLDDVRATKDSPGVKEAWDTVIENYGHLEEGSDDFLREVIAHVGENPKTALEQGWFKRLIIKIRQWLYRLGLRGKLTDEDIAGLVVSSLRRAMKVDRQSQVKTGRRLESTKSTDKPITESQFYSQYAQHIDLRGRQSGNALENREKILREGFKKGVNVNAMPPYRGGNPMSIVERNYMPKKGDVVYLAPKSAWKDTPNGMAIQNGWMPKPYEAIVIKEDGPSMYEEYVRAFEEDAGKNLESRRPTVDVMQQAIEAVGEKEFRERVRLHMEQFEGEEMEPAEIAAETEGVARQIVSETSPAKQTDTPAFRRWFGDSKVVDEDGKPLVVYHGAKRPDRIGNRFRKARATSGPMAFFTDDSAMASSYATSKSDTSLEAPDDYNAWFKFRPQGSRSEVDIDRAWYFLTQEQREKVRNTLPHVVNFTPEGDEMDGYRLGDSDEYGLSGKDHWDWNIKQAQGNILKAAKEIWLNSGSIINNEQDFMEVLRLGGMPMSQVRFDHPHAEFPAVLPVYLSIQNPLVTTNIPDSVVSGLERMASKSRVKPQQYGADLWDKRKRDLREWVAELKKDIAAGKNSHVWTSIPDQVTETLKSLGYDGINDTGGKGGGVAHHVWIPFEETQVKSATGNRGTFDPDDANILRSLRPERPTAPDSEFHEENRRLREEDKTVWNRARSFWTRNFLPGGLLPKDVFDEKIQRDNKLNVVEFDTTHLVKTLESAVELDYGERFEELPEQDLNKLRDALAGKVSMDIPERTRSVIYAMRQYIDRATDAYLAILQRQVDELSAQAEGSMDEGDGAEAGQTSLQAEAKARLLETMTANRGKYVHRSYRAFDDADWFRKVPESVVDSARRYLINRNVESGMAGDEASAAADRAVNLILKDGTAYDSMESFIKESKLGAKDLTVLKKREDIAPEIRALLGEYTDPRMNFAKTATKMGRLIWNQHFLDRVREIGKGTFLFDEDEAPPTATRKIAAEGNESYAPLNGLWTYPEIDQAFRDALGKEQMANWYKHVVQINGLVKYGKTILSPTTAARNWQSAMFFALANGHFNLGHVTKSVAGLKEYFSGTGRGEQLAYLRKLKDLGVVYDNANAGEVMRLLADSKIEDFLREKKSLPARALRGMNEFAQKAYSYGDDFWKIIGFENEKRALIEAGMTDAQAEKEAADRIRNTYPTYSLTGRGIKALARFPLAGTFVNFPAEIIRTSANMLRYVHKDWSDGRKALATKRAVGLAMVSGFFYALQAMTKAMFGVDDEEEEALRLMAAPWNRNANLAFAGRDKDGKLQYFDMSFLDPYSYFKKPLNAILRDQPWEDKATQAITEAVEPFLGVDIAAGAIRDIVTNKKESGGKVFNEFGSPAEMTGQIAEHLRKALQPGIASNIERTWKALSGQHRTSGEPYDLGDEAMGWIGWRASQSDPKTALYYRSFEFADAKAAASKTLNNVVRKRDDVDQDDIADAYESSNRQLQDAYRQMELIIAAAKKSNMNPLQIRQVLRASGISEHDTNTLMRGKTPKLRVQQETINNSVKKARQLYGPEQAMKVRQRYLAANKMATEAEEEAQP